jgi:hypothetical protein
MKIFQKLVDSLAKNFDPCDMKLQARSIVISVSVERVFLSLLIIVIPHKPGRQ